MNRHLILISSLLLLQIPIASIKAAPPSITQKSICKIEREDEFYSTKELQTLANKITVKVIGDNNGGSGTLIGKQGNNYLVLTNSHVIQGVNSIKLQTADGKTYSAEIVPQNKFKNSDITLLKFQSSQNYCLSEIAKETPNIDTPVVAAGFSGSTGNIAFSEGEVKKTSNLKEGYEIGYSSNIEQGMSGGAILNSMGELVGINGKSAYPILNTGYVYQNGKRPNQAEIQEMRKLSWGIPISTVLTWVDSDVLTAYKLPLPEYSGDVPIRGLTGWLGELEQKAKQFTVRIDSSSNANGSGIIIAKEGNTYTVLTSAHVLCERQDATKPCGGFSYEIFAPDGNKYSVDKSSIKIEEGVDLAVVKFKSSEDYQIATLADYNPNEDDYMFTAGFPKLKNNSPWRFTIGRIFEKEQGLIQVNQSDFQNDDSDELQSAISLTGGYELVYTSITYGGMSGGPVLDSLGRVIGIHGRSEGEQAGDVPVQIGYSLGVPVSTFLGLASRLGTKPQQLENIRPPQLNAQKEKSIEEAVLSTDVSGGNATAAQWLERGNQLWRSRRYDEAVKAFDEAIKQKPSFVYLAYYGKGLALGLEKKYKEAITASEQATKLKPGFVAGWKRQSLDYRKLKRLDKALFTINKAIQLQPENPNLYLIKRVILSDLKQYAQAEVAITEAIKLSPRALFYDSRGILYRNQKKWDLALADYNQAININPEDASVYINRGNLYKDKKKWDLALADYNKAIQINPENASAYNNRGILNQDKKKWDLALADYNKAIQINPENAKTYFNRGLVYIDQKKWDLALADYNKAIQINPEYAKAYNNRASLYDDQKKWELALADYNTAIQINPEYAKAYNNRGILYKKQKKWNLALADYSKAIQINPDDASAYNNRAVLYHDQKKWDLALADYNKAIQINPENATAYFNRASHYDDQKKWDLALADYNKAIQINPDDAGVYNNRALIYRKQKKWDLAVADYNKAIQINPKYAIAYFNRAKLYSEQKKWELAVADYNKAIQINPEYANAYNSRGILYSNQNQLDLSLADFNKAIQINPEYAKAYNNRAIIYQKQNQLDLALKDHNRAIQINPNYAKSYQFRGILYTNKKKWDLAVADYSKAIKINPNNARFYQLRGTIYSQQKKWELALADFNKAIKINPEDGNILSLRGTIHVMRGNKQQAIEDLQKAIPLLKTQNNTVGYQMAVKLLQQLLK
ncbi:MAG: tetratricopeptide repeat protein [Rivularia sp. (in: Bacteria)]|nr:tetratricopeptide repeat protein [Rivularia sp. MS3]